MSVNKLREHIEPSHHHRHALLKSRHPAPLLLSGLNWAWASAYKSQAVLYYTGDAILGAVTSGLHFLVSPIPSPPM